MIEEQKTIATLMAAITEFETWLEKQCKEYTNFSVLFPPENTRCETLNKVSDKWHECKERIRS